MSASQILEHLEVMYTSRRVPPRVDGIPLTLEQIVACDRAGLRIYPHARAKFDAVARLHLTANDGRGQYMVERWFRGNISHCTTWSKLPLQQLHEFATFDDALADLIAAHLEASR